MAAANPAAQRVPTVLPPYYRRYELPWSPSEEMERRFRTILRNLAIAFAIIAVIMPFLPRHKIVVNTESLPERVVQLVMEPPPPPPPPPPPKPEKPAEKAPAVPKPVVPVDPQVKEPNLGASGQGTGSGGSGKASRSADEIALVFTKNKGAIDAMYARALRDSPALQGKVVLELTISPSGDITAARIVSSELNDKEFESKLLARIRLFKFEATEVATLTATKPIDFFPAG